MYDIVAQIADLYRDAIKNSGHSASHRLENFRTEVRSVDKYFEVYFLLEGYWKYLENGRRAGRFPPPDAILKWIKVKPIVPHAINNRVPSTEQLAFLIARKIATYGTPATKLLQNTMDSPQTDALIDQLCDIILKQIEEETNKYIDDEVLE